MSCQSLVFAHHHHFLPLLQATLDLSLLLYRFLSTDQHGETISNSFTAPLDEPSDNS